MSWAPTMSMLSGWAHKKTYACLRGKVGKECDKRCFHYHIGFGLKFDDLYVPHGSRNGAVVQPTAEGVEK